MNARHLCLFAAALLFAVQASARQQPEVPAASPPAKVQQRVGVTDFSVDYSSPGVKGRKIFGGLVPFGELWRTGANASTRLEASRDFTFGDKKVRAGTYSVFTIPGESSWKVMLNSDANASTGSYDKKKDVATITVKPTKLSERRERLAFIFSETTDDSTRLDIEWDTVRVSVPVKVDTKAFVMANIDEATGAAWRPHWISARYLLENDGDLKQALAFANTSIGVKSTWWNQWTKAQILAKQGRKKDASAAAKEAQKVGKGDYVYENFYKETIAKAITEWK